MSIKVQLAADAGGASGGGEGETITLEGKSFAVSGPATFEPEYVESVEATTSGKTETITDQCGYSEVRKNGDTNWSITAEGIMSDQQLPGFLAVARLAETFTISSQLYAGPMVVDAPTVTQKDEDVTIVFPSGGTKGNAFHWQLQCKEPTSQYGGGVIPNFS